MGLEGYWFSFGVDTGFDRVGYHYIKGGRMSTNRLLKTIERHEGYRQFPYHCTAGKLSCAIGRNLEDKGISYTEALYLLKNDIDECVADLEKIFSDQFDKLPDHIQEVMVNMRFQLGPGGFRSFRKFIAAIRAWDIGKAKVEMLDSKWAKHDTPGRANELAEVLVNGFKENHPG
jgi:lysozyme